MYNESKKHNGSFCDLTRCLTIFRQKFPEIQLFSKITVNTFGDFIIESGENKYLLTHDTYDFYKYEGWTNREWVQL